MINNIRDFETKYDKKLDEYDKRLSEYDKRFDDIDSKFIGYDKAFIDYHTHKYSDKFDIILATGIKIISMI
jgi:hypothetical protein